MSDTEISTVTKTCKQCGEEKSITEFYRAKGCKDGCRPECKKCFLLKIDRKQRAVTYKIYCEKNKDKRRVTAKAWREANKQRRAEYSKSYAKANKQRLLEYNKAHAKANPEQYAARSRNRRALKRAAKGTHTAADIHNLLALQRKKCVACHKSIAKGYHVDHIVPLSSGGSNDKYNLQLLCSNCNQTKYTRDNTEFMQSKGNLI